MRTDLTCLICLIAADYRYPIIATGFLFQLKFGRTSAPRLPQAELT